jgi:hypothetical protein
MTGRSAYTAARTSPFENLMRAVQFAERPPAAAGAAAHSSIVADDDGYGRRRVPSGFGGE